MSNKALDKMVLSCIENLQETARHRPLAEGEQFLTMLCADYSNRHKVLDSLVSEMVTHLTWMVAHFDFAREQTGLNDEISPELKAAKEFLAKLNPDPEIESVNLWDIFQMVQVVIIIKKNSVRIAITGETYRMILGSVVRYGICICWQIMTR